MKIEKLSLEQLALIPQVRDEWLKIAMDTTPVDRAKVREILGRLYAFANKPVPNHIIHLDSPLLVSKAIANMRSENSSVSQAVSQEVSEQVSQEVRINAIKQAIGPYYGTINLENVYTKVSRQVDNQVVMAISIPVGSQMDRVYGRVQAAIKDQFNAVISWEDDFGQCDHSLPSCDFYGRIGIDVSKLEPAFDLAKNCGWSVLYWDWAFISAKPEYIKRDEQNLLHCETGPAVRYPDGFSVSAIHGKI
jgi:hypothetical protein